MNYDTSPKAQGLHAFVDGIGLLGPGFSSWELGRQYLNGQLPFEPAKCVLPSPDKLPVAERRRAGAVVRVSLAVGLEAVGASGHQPSELISVFSSSSGDAINCHEICCALASDDRLISPTRFHNSVHNAPSGYWSIANGATASSSVLCGCDASFGAGLLESMVQVKVDDCSVLLVVYDTPYPAPLHSKRPISDTMGVAMVLSSRQSMSSLARISLHGVGSTTTGIEADRLESPVLEALRQSIPAARALPLLQAIARRKSGAVVLDYLDDTPLSMDLTPCRPI